MVGFADDILFYLIELVNTKHAACILPVGAGLTSEAGTKGNEEHGQVFGLEYFILEHAGNRDFSCTDEECIIVLDGVDLVSSLGELSVTDKAELTRHRWHNERSEPLPDHAIQGKIHQSQFKPCRVVLENVAARACNLDAALDIHHVKFLHERIVIAWLKIKRCNPAPVPDGHVVALVLANRCARIGDIGYQVEQLLAFLQKCV